LGVLVLGFDPCLPFYILFLRNGLFPVSFCTVSSHFFPFLERRTRGRRGVCFAFLFCVGVVVFHCDRISLVLSTSSTSFRFFVAKLFGLAFSRYRKIPTMDRKLAPFYSLPVGRSSMLSDCLFYSFSGFPLSRTFPRFPVTG